MEIPSNIVKLIEKIKLKTLERKLVWENTSRETEYKCIFSSGEFITIDRWWETATNSNFSDFWVYNSSGGKVDRVFTSLPSAEYDFLIGLYEVVVKSVTKSDETYDHLFGELDNL
jgi:hypothetical protein